MVLLKNGSKGDQVVELQRMLKSLGYDLKDDGSFGGTTERYVREAQRRFKLKDDGIVGKDTWGALQAATAAPVVSTGKLTEADYQWAADFLKTSVAAVKAVREVEAPFGGFLADGHVTILYERHVMYKRLQLNGIDPTKYAVSNPDIVNTATGGYLGKAAEYTRLDKAKQIHIESALESCSWGAYQIMGYQWKILGFKDVHEFVATMSTGERGQLECFVKFIQHESLLLNSIRAKDWATFARWYNGPSYKKNDYDVKLAAAYSKYGGV